MKDCLGLAILLGKTVEVFLEGKRAWMLSRLKKMTKVYDKELLRELHGVRAVKAHHHAQSVLFLYPFFTFPLRAASPSVFREPTPTKPQIS